VIGGNQAESGHLNHEDVAISAVDLGFDKIADSQYNFILR
jgi:hypothetical protein